MTTQITHRTGTYYTETAVEITDKMVEVAVRTWFDTATGTDEGDMHAALSATLAVATPPAEEVDLGAFEFGDKVTNALIPEIAAGHQTLLYLGSETWARHGARVCQTTHIAAFTLPDGTRARRDGEHADGTPRFVKVREGEK